MVFGLVFFAAAFAPAVTVHGDWGVINRGGRCDALAASVLRPANNRARAIAGFAFVRTGSPWGRFQSRLSRLPRPGASAVLKIGNEAFLLDRRGDVAWSRNPRQDQAILSAVRAGGTMRLDSRDGAGRRFTDTFSLAGAPTAIDAAAALCASRASGQSR